MPETNEQYDSIIANCTEIFSKKMKDYGSAWRILRTSSLTDQIFIKAKRIRSIEENILKGDKTLEVEEDEENAASQYEKNTENTETTEQ